MSDAIRGTANAGLATWLTTGKARAVENFDTNLRTTAYGEAMTASVHGVRVPGVAEEGSYWVATNTPGTPIIDKAASTAFVATTPTLVLVNNNPVGGKNIYPLRFKCQVVAPGTSGTNWACQWLVDTGKRYTSGGTAMTTTNPNLSVSTTATGALAYFGAITAPAANASRIIGASQMRSVIKVAGDEYVFEFGNSAPNTTGMTLEGTAQVQRLMQLPPVVIPPQCSLLWYEYGASQGTAASFDFLGLEFVER